MKKLFQSVVLVNYIHIAYHLFLFGLVLFSCETTHLHNKEEPVLSKCQFPIESIVVYSYLEEGNTYLSCYYDNKGRVLKEESFSSLDQDYVITKTYSYQTDSIVILTKNPLRGNSNDEFFTERETVNLH